MNGRMATRKVTGGQSFLLGQTLSGLQSVDENPSALSGSGIGKIGGVKMGGSGLEQINEKLGRLMIKAKKTKPANIKFSM
jgi:hypothetical protein